MGCLSENLSCPLGKSLHVHNRKQSKQWHPFPEKNSVRPRLCLVGRLKFDSSNTSLLFARSLRLSWWWVSTVIVSFYYSLHLLHPWCTVSNIARLRIDLLNALCKVQTMNTSYMTCVSISSLKSTWLVELVHDSTRVRRKELMVRYSEFLVSLSSESVWRSTCKKLGVTDRRVLSYFPSYWRVLSYFSNDAFKTVFLILCTHHLRCINHKRLKRTALWKFSWSWRKNAVIKKKKTGFARLWLAFPAAGRGVKCQHQGSKQALLLLFPNNANKNSLIQQTTRKSLHTKRKSQRPLLCVKSLHAWELWDNSVSPRQQGAITILSQRKKPLRAS